MARFNQEVVVRWSEMADKWLLSVARVNRLAVVEGSMAWRVAHMCGITEEAYSDRMVTDAHIVTALRKVFPNAVFKDRY